MLFLSIGSSSLRLLDRGCGHPPLQDHLQVLVRQGTRLRQPHRLLHRHLPGRGW